MLLRIVQRLADRTPNSSVTELPFKIPYYAALLSFLVADAAQDSASGIGMHIIVRGVMEDFVKGFQVYLDGLKWRELRLCVSLFASDMPSLKKKCLSRLTP